MIVGLNATGPSPFAPGIPLKHDILKDTQGKSPSTTRSKHDSRPLFLHGRRSCFEPWWTTTIGRRTTDLSGLGSRSRPVEDSATRIPSKYCKQLLANFCCSTMTKLVGQESSSPNFQPPFLDLLSILCENGWGEVSDINRHTMVIRCPFTFLLGILGSPQVSCAAGLDTARGVGARKLRGSRLEALVQQVRVATTV